MAVLVLDDAAGEEFAVYHDVGVFGDDAVKLDGVALFEFVDFPAAAGGGAVDDGDALG